MFEKIMYDHAYVCVIYEYAETFLNKLLHK